MSINNIYDIRNTLKLQGEFDMLESKETEAMQTSLELPVHQSETN